MGRTYLLMEYLNDGTRRSTFMHDASSLPKAKAIAAKLVGSNCTSYEVYKAQTDIIPNIKIKVNKETAVVE